MPKLSVRDLMEEDLDDVCRIEEASFSMPWKREDFKELIYNEKALYKVLMLDDKIIGCAGYTDNGYEGYINNVVIEETHRGNGYSRLLLESIINEGKEKGVNDFTLEVRVSNTPAVKLYESLGFESAGIRKKFYEHPVEDAFVMWKHS